MNNLWMGIGAAGLASLIALGASGSAQSGTVNFDLKVNVNMGGAPLELGKTYKTPAGVEYSVNLLKFYTSNLQLLKADGSSVGVPGVSLTSWSSEAAVPNPKLMETGQMFTATTTQGATIFRLQAPAGEYKGLRFEVGVPKELNNRDASTLALPLGLESGMFWAWNPGYIFFRIEGKASVKGKSEPWLMHMGTDAWRMSVNAFDLSSNKVKLSVTEGGSYTVNLDLAKLFARGPKGEASWDLTDDAQRVMHGGPNMGQAYINLLGAWSGQ